jgi:hypothetical protein
MMSGTMSAPRDRLVISAVEIDTRILYLLPTLATQP